MTKELFMNKWKEFQNDYFDNKIKIDTNVFIMIDELLNYIYNMNVDNDSEKIDLPTNIFEIKDKLTK